MISKKEIKKNIKQTLEIERMLLQFLSDPKLPEDQVHLVVGELIQASGFIARFKDALKEMETTNTNKYKKGDK